MKAKKVEIQGLTVCEALALLPTLIKTFGKVKVFEVFIEILRNRIDELQEQLEIACYHAREQELEVRKLSKKLSTP